MADKLGAEFAARISGVARFGLFVTLLESGANGLLPLSSLPDDYWMHDETTQTLYGRRTRQSFRLTQEIAVRLREASPVTGGLVFGLAQTAGKRAAAGGASKGEHRVHTSEGGKKRGRR
jgi:ribonuclease R